MNVAIIYILYSIYEYTILFLKETKKKKKKKCPDPAAGHCRPTPPPETPGHSRASLGQSLGGSLLLSPGS